MGSRTSRLVVASHRSRPEGRGDRPLHVGGEAGGHDALERTSLFGWRVPRRWCSGSGRPRAPARHRVQTCKLGGDPRFEENLVDVVSLYLDPPENALDHSQPSPPIKPGPARTMTHDHKAQRHHKSVRRVGCGERVGDRGRPLLPSHCHVDFLTVPANDRPAGPETATDSRDPRQRRHPQPPQRQCLAGRAHAVRTALHPDLQQLAEHGRNPFSQLTDEALRRENVHSVPDLIDATKAYLAAHNEKLSRSVGPPQLSRSATKGDAAESPRDAVANEEQDAPRGLRLARPRR
jgi:hypothetical protein